MRVGADMEERNDAGYTPFHVALQEGHMTILKYFFDAHKPDDSEAVYEAPPSKSLLALAVESAQPEVVWMVLDKKLASIEDMTDAWVYITCDGRKAILNKPGLAEPHDQVEEIVNLLTTFGGFTKEAEPKPEAKLVAMPQTHGYLGTLSPPLSAEPGRPPPMLPSQNGHSLKNYRNRSRKSALPSTPSQASPNQLESSRPASASGQETPPQSATDKPNTEHSNHFPPPRGRGRNYGRSRGRGRGFKGGPLPMPS